MVIPLAQGRSSPRFLPTGGLGSKKAGPPDGEPASDLHLYCRGGGIRTHGLFVPNLDLAAAAALRVAPDRDKLQVRGYFDFR
jgi:hypothetical protein